MSEYDFKEAMKYFQNWCDDDGVGYQEFTNCMLINYEDFNAANRINDIKQIMEGK